MKEGWERRNEIIQLTGKDLNEILKTFDSSFCVMKFELLGDGFSHTNYKVTSNDRNLVVRIAKDRENLLKEYNLHTLLASDNSIPKFYLVGEYHGHHFAILEWKEGVLLKERFLTYNPSQMHEAGYALGLNLGGFSEYRFQESGFLDSELNVSEPFELTPKSFLNTMEYFLFKSKMPKWLNEGQQTELMNFCVKHARLFELDTSAPRLVHGDFNGLNILMDETNVSAILDWEYVIAGSMYLDIGNLIRYEDYPGFQQFKTGLSAGLCESGERLPEQWEQIAKITDLIALSSMLDNDFGGTNRVLDINRLIEKTLDSPLFNTI